MIDSVLSIHNLKKSYGKIQALKGVSFDVPKGAVFGILGPNGSGKTTMLAIILDVLQPNEGSFEWFGQAGNPDVRKRIGSLLETPNFYHYLSAVDNLIITQAINKRGTIEDIHQALEIVKLTERKHSPFSSYSLGMKQRLAIAAALLAKPDVIILDEPTNGLDPVGIVEIRELIILLAKQGTTVIMASHLLDEVEKVCSHVAILKSGNLMASGEVNEILKNEDIVEIGATNLQQLPSIFSNYPHLISKKLDNNHLQLNFQLGTANLETINKFCFEKGFILNHLQLKNKSLQTKFFELTN